MYTMLYLIIIIFWHSGTKHQGPHHSTYKAGYIQATPSVFLDFQNASQ